MDLYVTVRLSKAPVLTYNILSTDYTTSREEPGVGTLGPIDNGFSSSAYSGEPPPLTDIQSRLEPSGAFLQESVEYQYYSVLASERSPNH
jgi:hypothetical protein